jgi:glycosyltransferase involved in cell wall biosynthesis
MSTASSGAKADAAPVAVVIPCFQARGTLRRALDSVLAQTRPPRELIAVDDASSDGTWEELQQLQAELGKERLRLLRLERNRGPASARNAGWEAARAELIAFLDADDSWHPHKLETQARFMQAHPEVTACGHARVVPPEVLPQAAPPAEPSVTWIGFRDLLWRNRIMTSSAMVRRQAPFRFADGQRYMEDHRLWLEMARAGCRIARLETPLAAHHKPVFGAAGLSANLWAMEKAELRNYRGLHRARAIGTPMLAVLGAWSVAKFLRRVVLKASGAL